jgi:hypothetical protein
LDPTILRLIFVLLAFAQGVGVVLYVILWFILPSEARVGESDVEGNIQAGAAEFSQRAGEIGRDLQGVGGRLTPQVGLIIGGALILYGVLSLLSALNISWLSWLEFNIMWPIFIVAAGVILLWRAIRGG